MMRLKIGVLFFISIFLGSCIENKVEEKYKIVSVWELENVSGGFAGIDLDYNTQSVVLEFYQNNTVLIQNNTLPNTEQQSFSGFVSGTFSYKIKTENSIGVLYINNIKQGEITITDFKLIINDGLATDGFLKTLKRTSLICGVN